MDGAATWNLSSEMPRAQPENQFYGRSLCELGLPMYCWHTLYNLPYKLKLVMKL